MNLVSELFLEEFPAPILLVNKKSHCIEYVNNQLKSFVPTHPTELIGKCFSDWALHIHDLSFNENTREFLALGGERIIVKENEFIFVCATFQLITHNNEEKYLLLLHDITNLKSKIDQHKNAEKEYRDLVENVSDIIYKTDDKGYFIYINPTASRVTGYSEGELIGKHFTKLIRLDHQEKIMSFYKNNFIIEKGALIMNFQLSVNLAKRFG